MVTVVGELSARGVAGKALTSPMDATTPAGRAFLQSQAALAGMERNVIRQRVREGLGRRAGPRAQRWASSRHDGRKAPLRRCGSWSMSQRWQCRAWS